MAMFDDTGKAIRVCEPFSHYAYPLSYEIPLASKGVAMAVVGQRLYALTTGDAVVVVGSDPASLDDEPAKINRPCLSARSVVEFNEGADIKGVAWASTDGLCWLSESAFAVVTKDMLTPAQWQALAPSTMKGVRYRNFYLGFYNDGTAKGFCIDLQNPTGIYFLDFGCDAVFHDPLSDTVYLLQGNSVKAWDAGEALTVTVRSKRMEQPTPLNIGAIEVLAKTYPVAIKLWGDGQLILSTNVTDREPIRPPLGWEASQLQVEAAGSNVVAVRIAPSVRDLMSV